MNENVKYLIETPNGWCDFSGIRKKITGGIVTIITNSEKTLECTFDHLLYTIYGWQAADTLEVGDMIMTIDDYERVTFVYLDKNATQSVYDVLNVQSEKCYYTNGILSHNCGFLGSSGTLIEGSKLNQLVIREPIQDIEGIKQYKRPEKDRSYVMVVDVSRGKGLDYSAFQVLDVTSMPYQQVCSFRDNMITPIDYAEIIFRVMKLYNEAFVLVEVNDIGEQVSDTLHFEFEVETLLYTESAGRSGKRISAGFGTKVDKGIRTTKSVKSIGCNMLKMMVEQDQLIINDFETINELSTFSRKGVSYEAESGCNDDLVMGLVLFGWLTDQAFFKEMTDINTLSRLKQRNEEEMDESLMPLGFNDYDLDEVVTLPIGNQSSWFNY